MIKNNQPLYIESVELENYRSIQHLNVDFNPGLNILIGENGSGKTNIMRFLNVYTYGWVDQELAYAKGKVVFKGKRQHQLIFDNLFEQLNYASEPSVEYNPGNSKRSLSQRFDDVGHVNVNWVNQLTNVVNDEQCRFQGVFIPHGLDNDLFLWTLPINNATIKLRKNKVADVDEQRRLFGLAIKEQQRNNFVRAFSEFVYTDSDSIDADTFCSNLIAHIDKVLFKLVLKLKNNTPVKNVRLSPNAIIRYVADSNEIMLYNIYFEFFAEESWKSFSQLSDGTKRMVYIMSELTDYHPNKNGIKETKIVFIEEPEIGVNPHQLHILMLALKHEARDKQIFITTHSPIALDALERDEIDSILICENDHKTGTKLRRLTNKEKEKALGYMDEVGYLSLYWSHSDLQKNKD